MFDPSDEFRESRRIAEKWRFRENPYYCCGPAYAMYRDRLEREEKEWAKLREALNDISGARFVPTIDGPVH